MRPECAERCADRRDVSIDIRPLIKPCNHFVCRISECRPDAFGFITVHANRQTHPCSHDAGIDVRQESEWDMPPHDVTHRYRKHGQAHRNRDESMLDCGVNRRAIQRVNGPLKSLAKEAGRCGDESPKGGIGTLMRKMRW